MSMPSGCRHTVAYQENTLLWIESDQFIRQQILAICPSIGIASYQSLKGKFKKLKSRLEKHPSTML